MPWTASEAKSKTKKADTPEKASKWAKIANHALKEGKGDGYAIRVANAAMDAVLWVDGEFDQESWDAWSEEAREAAAESRKRNARHVASLRAPGERQRREREKRTPGWGRSHVMAYGHTSRFGSHGDEALDGRDGIMSELFRVMGDAAPQRVAMCDAIELDDAAKVMFTKDGYLKAMPRIARTGIQIYAGSECGRPDMERVRVYRPEDSVFAPDTVKGYTHLPVTLEHPPKAITPDNWKQYAIGDTGDEVLRDGGSVRVPMMLRDSAAIKAFKDGKNQLSVGYTCDLLWEDGRTEDGQDYDAVQTNITPNHLAQVAAARGGSTLVIGDDNRQERSMTLKTVVVDGISCEMTDTAAALVQRTIQKFADEAEDFKKKKKEECDSLNAKIATITTESAAKDAKITTLEKQLVDSKITPQALDALVKDRQIVFDKAKKLLGDKLVTDGKSIEDVRKQVVDKLIGDAAKSWDENMVKASFDTLTVNVSAPGGTVQDAARVFAGQHRPGGPGYGNVQDVRDTAYDGYVQDITDAWKTPEQRAADAAVRNATRQ